jgi:hypothetical protein
MAAWVEAAVAARNIVPATREILTVCLFITLLQK